MPPLEFRIAMTVQDYEQAKAFYIQALGLEVIQEWDNPPGQGILLALKNATLELLDPQQAAQVDQVEAGARVSGVIRFALEVESLSEARQTLESAGARVLHEPVATPWGDHNQRLQAPDGMQITLYAKPAE